MYLSPLPTGGSAWKTVGREGSFWALWAQGAPKFTIDFFSLSVSTKKGSSESMPRQGCSALPAVPHSGSPEPTACRVEVIGDRSLQRRADLPLASVPPCQDEG